MHRFLLPCLIAGLAACDAEPEFMSMYGLADDEAVTGFTDDEAVNTAPCDAFFANIADRDTYSYPLDDAVCLIERAGEATASYSRRTETTIDGGVPAAVLVSENGEYLAISSEFLAIALERGFIDYDSLPRSPPGDQIGETSQPIVATAIALGVRACARNAKCSHYAVETGKWLASGAAFDGLKECVSWVLD